MRCAKLLDEPMDLLLVIGGYNSSNTSHLAEMGEAKLPTYFVKNAAQDGVGQVDPHYNLHQNKEVETRELAAGRQNHGRHHGRRFVSEQFDRGRHSAFRAARNQARATRSRGLSIRLAFSQIGWRLVIVLS